jgi:hypothetical protein
LREFYPDAGEKIPNDLTLEKETTVKMNVYLDAHHAHDVVTRKSITEILDITNNTLIRWISKYQKTVEILNHGSELVASTIATDFFLEIRYMFRTLGVALYGLAFMLEDNMSADNKVTNDHLFTRTTRIKSQIIFTIRLSK